MSFAVERFKVVLRDRFLPNFLFRWRAALNHVPDSHLYNPTFQPWLGSGEFRQLYDEIAGNTLITREAAWALYSLARQTLSIPGDFLEAGVYRGGTARLFRRLLDTSGHQRTLHLFDTFGGMPETNRTLDIHREKDFLDTSVEAVSTFIGTEEWICYHKGFIPDTFKRLENVRFAFAHIDVDIYQSVLDCCGFIYPRVVPGGILVFDDYGLPSCPGARVAVDAFFQDKPEIPFVLHSGQAIVFRTAGRQYEEEA
jgi:O-methyltransferase